MSLSLPIDCDLLGTFNFGSQRREQCINLSGSESRANILAHFEDLQKIELVEKNEVTAVIQGLIFRTMTCLVNEVEVKQQE